MNVVSIMGILSAFAFLIPVCVIVIHRLFTIKSLLALLINLFITALYNLMRVDIIITPDEWESNFNIFGSYLEVPLMLTTLLFFCTTSRCKKIINLSLYSFICYELVVTFIVGLNTMALKYIMGPGILILFVHSCYLFSHSVKVSFKKEKCFGKLLIIAAILFAYGCYGMIYCFIYLLKSTAIDDIFLIYDISSLFASMLMGIGLIIYCRRVIHIKELLQTRKELQAFFGS